MMNDITNQSHAPATASEKYLARLCRGSFLSLWSWPNVYRDQKAGGTKVGKEVCDLLVVFDRHIFIFSDKYCAFPESGDIALDWSRWFKRAVVKSADQVWGAERWLREFPDRVFVDRDCTKRLPVKLPLPGKAVFHRIVVAHGSGERCRTELGGTGSLMITPMATGSDHYNTSSPRFLPFAVGRISPTREFVHVIDDFSLDVLLRTLDTVTDLASYLEKKAKLVESGKLGAAAGEEDLLAYYLRDIDESGAHYFRIPDGMNGIFIDQGLWAAFQRHPDRIAQVEADRISYAWDGLIEKFAKHLLSGTQYFSTHSSVGEQEIAFRFLAREPRVRRRTLAKALIGILQKGNLDDRATRWIPATRPGDPYYVFLSLKLPSNKTYDEYRVLRRTILEASCLTARVKDPAAEDIVGIASEPWSPGSERSEDFLYLDGRGWTEEMVAQAEETREKLGLMTQIRSSSMVESEYPLQRNLEMRKGRNRNRSCPCGSGKKYKKCCGGS